MATGSSTAHCKSLEHKDLQYAVTEKLSYLYLILDVKADAMNSKILSEHDDNWSSPKMFPVSIIQQLTCQCRQVDSPADGFEQVKDCQILV